MAALFKLYIFVVFAFLWLSGCLATFGVGSFSNVPMMSENPIIRVSKREAFLETFNEHAPVGEHSDQEEEINPGFGFHLHGGSHSLKRSEFRPPAPAILPSNPPEMPSILHSNKPPAGERGASWLSPK
mmetsp:Transcript_22191/g.33440  ORF Transcript_22191/g.33440 Transcript_22191/m.33440 type:complete len:128 (+) Transcript_22191:260-643(+)